MSMCYLCYCAFHEQRMLFVAGELSPAVRCLHFEETGCKEMYDCIFYMTISNIFKGMRDLFVHTCCEVVGAWRLELAVTGMELPIILTGW